MPEGDRRGKYGSANPAFTVHRFKRSIVIVVNEEMAEELNDVLMDNEQSKGQVPSYLYEFASQLQDALDQPPPNKGEKPLVLAPGRRRREAA